VVAEEVEVEVEELVVLEDPVKIGKCETVVTHEALSSFCIQKSPG